MSDTWFSVVITIWLGAHPFTYTLAQAYPFQDLDKCFAQQEMLKVHWTNSVRRKIRHTIECEPTDIRGEI